MSNLPDVQGRREYEAFGIKIRSDVPLHVAPSSGEADISLRICGVRAERDLSWGGDPEREPACFQFEEAGSSVLVFPFICEFVIENWGDTVDCYAYDELDDDGRTEVGSLFVDHVVPRWLSARGNVVLHGSAAVTPGGAAVAFVGPSGWGKSTISAVLSANGWRHLSDDGVRIMANGQTAETLPSYPSMRLLPDSATEIGGLGDGVPVGRSTGSKRQFKRLPDQGTVVGTRPLAAVFALVDPKASSMIRATRLGYVDATSVLVNRSFAVTGSDGKVGTQLFETCAALAESLPVYQLEYPRRYEYLEAVGELIESLLVAENKQP